MKRRKAYFNDSKSRRAHRSWPAVVLLTGACVATFLHERSMPPLQLAQWLERWAWHGLVGHETPTVQTILPAFSALFIHLGWAHLAGNMAYLVLFGPAIAKQTGQWSVFALFLLAGAAANVVTTIGMGAPTQAIVGASGAVAAVMGGFLALFPRRRIGIFLPLGAFLQPIQVPALLLIGIWFGAQIMQTLVFHGLALITWRAHVSGFLIGLALGGILSIFRPKV